MVYDIQSYIKDNEPILFPFAVCIFADLRKLVCINSNVLRPFTKYATYRSLAVHTM